MEIYRRKCLGKKESKKKNWDKNMKDGWTQLNGKWIFVNIDTYQKPMKIPCSFTKHVSTSKDYVSK